MSSKLLELNKVTRLFQKTVQISLQKMSIHSRTLNSCGLRNSCLCIFVKSSRNSLTRVVRSSPITNIGSINLVQSQSLVNLNSQKRFYTNRNLWALKERGLVSDVFPSDNPKKFVDFCNSKEQTVYAGFDPTADSLHVGNLAVIMMLLHCQRAGHNVIALIGGATGMIGDPSGRNHERIALDDEIVANNVNKISANLTSVFENHSKYFWDSKKGKEKLSNLLVVNNLDWYKNISSIELVGKIGRHFRMGTMLLKDSVKQRLNSEEGLSFTEFTYQIFQAYDWYHLLKNHNCYIQVGGHDQMGNILAGHDLISRALKKQIFGLTVPLVTTEEGNKYGKSAGNAIWLNDERTSAYEMYQFFIRSKDTDLNKLLRIFTFKTETEIDALLRRHQVCDQFLCVVVFKSPEERIGQKELAKNVTLLVHGEEGLNKALKTTEALYSENLEALSSLNVQEICEIFKKAGGRDSYLSEIFLEPGTTVLDMAIKAKCFENQKDAMRIIQAGGFYLNYKKVSNFDEMIVPGIHILPNKVSLARVGKKNYYVIKWNP